MSVVIVTSHAWLPSASPSSVNEQSAVWSESAVTAFAAPSSLYVTEYLVAGTESASVPKTTPASEIVAFEPLGSAVSSAMRGYFGRLFVARFCANIQTKRWFGAPAVTSSSVA